MVEDAAQAHGARRDGRGPGSLGDAAATSYYPGKNLGAYGDAGAVLTDSADLAALTRLIRDHGSPRKYAHEVAGLNSRMDTLQAVVLRAKLRKLAAWNAGQAGRPPPGTTRRSRASPRSSGRARLDGNLHVWHLYVIRVPDRDRVLAELLAAGIGAAIHYPEPIHRTAAFASLRRGRQSRPDCPVADRNAAQILSLPLHPQITADQQKRVVEVLVKAMR